MQLAHSLCESIVPSGSLVPSTFGACAADSACVRFQQRVNGRRLRFRIHLGGNPLAPPILSQLLRDAPPFPIRFLAPEVAALPFLRWHSFVYFDPNGSEVLRGAIADESEMGEGAEYSAALKADYQCFQAPETKPRVTLALCVPVTPFSVDSGSMLLPAPLPIQIIPSGALCNPVRREFGVGRYERALGAALEVQESRGGKRLVVTIIRNADWEQDKDSDSKREEPMVTTPKNYVEHAEQMGGQPLQFSVDLGALELSLKDFLSLQPGSVIHIPNIASSQGLLRYGGSPVAEVDIEVEHDGLSMKVREWLALPRCDSQGASGMES